MIATVVGGLTCIMTAIITNHPFLAFFGGVGVAKLAELFFTADKKDDHNTTI